MQTIIRRITRNSAPLTGFVSALIGMLLILDIITLTVPQAAAVMAVVGATILFLTAYITPISDPRLPIGTVVNKGTDQPTGVVVESSGQ